ncbi:MAG: phosphatase [Cycloclasticus sp. symbiont of Poecilosclerida sp. M]|nr:MAG: phosphatase [Cycloclasticus sp. symbiont of Poecilosclerida sp. M]
MKIDLHTHTFISDGALSPQALIDRAVERGVDMLSVTDHDTTDAYKELGANEQRIKLITGVEFSTQWRGMGIHIVGLNFDLNSPAIKEGVARQEQARAKRAELIAERLQKKKLAVDFQRVKEIAGGKHIGRPHFAQHLVELGSAKNMQDAFKKYIGDGKAGDVKQCWAEFDEVVSWVVGGGGCAVIAHPDKYKMTRTKLVALIDDFKAVGGVGVEVVSGRQLTNSVKGMARLCYEKGLLASCGSDFHQASSWSEVGSMAAFPKQCQPIWESW